MAEERPLEELVEWRLEDGVGWITLNRPEAKNALTMDMRDRVADLVEDASGDLRVRAVAITGTGKGFCTGADLRGGGRSSPRPDGAPDRASGDIARTIKQGWQRLVAAILDCEKPVVAGLNGTVAGGGCHLALACDLVLMADTASFVWAFTSRGIAPDAGGAYLLTRLVGPQRAKELFFFSDRVVAEHAVRIGLVNEVVPSDELEKRLAETAGRLAAGPTRAFAATKRLVNRALDVDRATSFEEEAIAQEIVATSADAQEGIASFIERRDPEFRGW